VRATLSSKNHSYRLDVSNKLFDTTILKTVILCYHKVGTEAEEGRWLNCAPETLASHARFFKRFGWPGILPRQFMASRPKGICFTFDDAYVSAVSHAPEVLEASGYRGAFFAVPSLVGQVSSWDADMARPLATWGELLGLVGRGHEVGNHTFTHPRLADLSLDEQIRELSEAQKMLSDRGIRAETVCYPYGSFNGDTLRAMKSVGLSVGLRLAKSPVYSESTMELNRIVVAFSDALPKLLYKIYVRPKLP
jgi:peptidoglycan/xylan/chitin deacetylase (PgdA/CDA1 family)